jgi:hypothetical protein
MNADDSEKRSAEHEHEHRFLASAARGSSKRLVGFILGMWAAPMFLFVVVHVLVPDTYSDAVVPISIGIWVIGGCALYFGFPDLVGRARRRNVVICVTGEELTVNPKRGKVLSFVDAQLGPWEFWGGMPAGSALHLRRDVQSFVVGGRDHRLDTRTRHQAPPTGAVQAWMWAEEFDALLATIGPRCGWDVRAPEVEAPTRCLLIPKSRYGFYSPLPNPSIAVDIGEDVISVIHLSSSASAVSVRRDRVRALQAQYLFKEGEKGSRFPRVALVLRIPDMTMLCIGCPVSRGLGWGRVPRKSSDRFSWRVEVLDWQEPPAYWVSAADWLTLVETFGLTPQLEDRARR